MRFIEPSYEILYCPDGEDVLRLLEAAARTCYKSEERTDDGREQCPRCDGRGRYKSDTWGGDRVACDRCQRKGRIQARKPSSHALIRKIIDSGHHSVIEHACITVRFVCNRGVTHELVRHRLASYSQESTRYCDYSKGKHGNELAIIEPSYRPAVDALEVSLDSVEYERRRVWCEALAKVERAYLKLIELGEKPQEARDILPIALKTEIVTTANLREWRHIFALRCSKRAHPQIRELMIPLRDELRQRIPIIFDASGVTHDD